ncbi:MAG TPA: M13-type metalloendopeptidase [Allosphingosinicella sp.]|uniref:M13 family metallopeptidase n=1 Tax=Allosphingosinicella sp. TaxID=2823234 RepID=UPI002ED7E3C2
MKQYLALLAATTALAACATTDPTTTEVAEQTATVAEAATGPVTPATAKKAQIGDWGFDLAGMDRSTEAGDNFYQFANGTWAKTTPIPADRSNYGMFTMLDDLSTQRTREILEEAAKTPGSKIGDFYTSFMDRTAVNAQGFTPIAPTLNRIDAAKNKTELAALMGDLSRMGVNVPFGNFVSSDDKDPNTNIFQISQGGIGLPDRDYYLSKDAGLVEKRNAYRAYLAQLLKLAGAPNADARAAAVLDLETKIAQAHWTQVESRDADKTYNRLTPAQLKQSAPAFAWDAYLDAIGVAGRSNFLVRQPSAVGGSAKIFAAASPAVVKDYLKLHTIDTYAPYLSQPFVDANFAFRGTALNGTPQNQDEWKRASNLVTAALGEEIGKVYVDRYFPPEAKAEADQLVKNVLAAMDRRIQGLTWMAPETKQRARAKLAAFTPKIGYPDEWRDYSGLEVRRGDLVGNVMRSNRFEHQRNLNKLGQPVDRGEWFMTPMTINAYANFNWNEIVFPAAILQPPFFDPNADPAINYGGIGAVIGHEISHHFDDQGSKYDETGALKEWWTPGDVQRFSALTGQLATQYDKYEIFPGKFVNGKFTLGENIGDLAGLAIAYDAYKASLNGAEVPVLDGFSGDQRFYMGWAQVWRRNYREANLLQRLITDPHSPSEQRAAVVRNLDPWYSAFNVSADDSLYLTPEQRVRIW